MLEMHVHDVRLRDGLTNHSPASVGRTVKLCIDLLHELHTMYMV